MKNLIVVGLVATVILAGCSKTAPEPIDPIEIFLNDPAAFRDFINDTNTVKAIAASPTTRMTFIENGNTAETLLDSKGNLWFFNSSYEIKNRASADKAIAILKSNPAEFMRFFKDARVASKIVEGGAWTIFELRFKTLERTQYIR